MAGESGLPTDQEISLINVLTDFPNYFNNFQTNFQALLAQSNYIVTKHPELRTEYDSLVNTASENYTKLVNIKMGLDKIEAAGTAVVDWVKGVFGFSGLGFIPLIIAGVSAVSAYAIITSVANWLTDTKKFASKLEFIKDQEAKGYSPAQAAQAATSIYGEPKDESLFFGLPVKWIIVGAVLIILGPPLINAFTGNRK
jgi:hypothetical protein